MSLSLHVDTGRWRDHLDKYVADLPDGVALVPVTKGNGYGLGNDVLAAEARRLGALTLAVGAYDEVGAVTDFDRDVLVLTPWRPHDTRAQAVAAQGDPRIIHTVSRHEDIAAIAAASSTTPRVVIEVRTSMRRHGVPSDDLTGAVAAVVAAGGTLEGIALHLPLTGDHTEEATRLSGAAIEAATTAGSPDPALWVSHLSPEAANQVAAATGATIRLRVGTALWLGDRGSLSARARVLDVHPVRRGERVGYRQRRVRRHGHLIVAGGGTAHGVGLEAPSPASTLRQRGVAAAGGLLDATGRALSPYSIASAQRWFAEPPHMQCSLLLLPDDVAPPAVGDALEVNVRYTTTSFDEVVWS